jgi:probable HAF family extracellular repeat protein
MNTRSLAACRNAVRHSIAAALCACAGAVGAQTYSFSLLPPSGDVTGGRFDSGSGINNGGNVVGTVGVTHQYWGQLWPSATSTPVTLSSSLCCTYTFTHANDINNAGWIVGEDTYRAALWVNNTATFLPALSEGQSTAHGINDAGQAVGYSSPLPGTTRATLWSGGQAIDLGTLGGNSSQAQDINNSGTVAGASQRAGDGAMHATLWHNGAPTALSTPDDAPSVAYDINDLGQAVGSSSSRAALWNAGSLTYLSSFNSSAHGINELGQVVGMTEQEPEDFRATLWNGGSGVDLNSFLSQSARDEGWVLQTANAINNLGWITGSAYNNQTFERSAYVLGQIPAVPEAGTLALWFAGLGVLAISSRRMRTRTAGVREPFGA